MTDRRREIKRENKKAMPLFFLLLLGGGIVGALAGILQIWMGDAIKDIGKFFTSNLLWNASFVLMVVSALFFHITGLISYYKCKKELKNWDGEEEETPNKIEVRMGYSMWGSSVNTILCFVCFAILMSTLLEENTFLAACAVVLFVANMCMVLLMQQKNVDFIKEMNPEKKGSIYDIHFTKKWMESCDEAERMQIYVSAWETYRFMSMVYIVMWLFLYFANLFFDTGVMGIIVVSVLWLLQTSIYCYKSIQQI